MKVTAAAIGFLICCAIVGQVIGKLIVLWILS